MTRREKIADAQSCAYCGCIFDAHGGSPLSSGEYACDSCFDELVAHGLTWAEMDVYYDYE